MKLVKAEDNKFCIGILENIQVLSEDIWGKKSVKEFPVTHTFMYWNKLWNDQHLNIKVSNAEVPQCLLKYNL